MTPSQMAMIGGAAVLYVSARSAVESLAGTATSPGRRAIGNWLPIAAVVAVAIFLNQPGMALSVILATSVGALSLATGGLALLEDGRAEPVAVSPSATRGWLLLLPVALMALLAGFAGKLTWVHGCVFGVEGILLLCVWLEGDERASRLTRWEKVNLILAALVMVLGAWMAVKGAVGLTRELAVPSASLIATTAVGPLLVLPMILGGANHVWQGRSWPAMATHVAVAQLNLCCLLPVAILLWYIHSGQPLSFPVSAWRVDSVVLVLLAAALLPVGAGWWRLGKAEGIGLIVLYVLYLLAVATVGG